MSLILDTHTAIWFTLNDPQLSSTAQTAIETEPGKVYISPASYWEIAIKIQKRNYQLQVPFQRFWERAIAEDGGGLTLLPIGIAHADRLITLPAFHRDPFDRMIVAQGLVEKLTLVSCDAILDRYYIPRIW